MKVLVKRVYLHEVHSLNEFDTSGIQMDKNNRFVYGSGGDHVNNQNVMYTNIGQIFVCNEQNICQFLDEYSVNTIKIILQEMQFFLNMTTCQATRKYLFTGQNRGKQKMQGIIDISYRHISTFALQIVNALNNLDASQKKAVFHWMYDECDKLCDQFQYTPLDRTDLFFEHLIEGCEKELQDRRITQSRSNAVKKIKSTFPNGGYQSNQQQINSNDFFVPPPPYTSPNSPYGTFVQSSYQPQTYFQTPLVQPRQQVQTSTYLPPNRIQHYSDAQQVSQATSFNGRSQQTNTMTQSHSIQRPMTAPIHCMNTETQSNVNRNANTKLSTVNTNQWPTQSSNPFQQLIPNVSTSLNRPQQSMQFYGIANNNNQNVNTTYSEYVIDQQSRINASGFEAMPIQRTANEKLNAVRKRNASTYPEEQVEKSARNESVTNSVTQSVQSQTQYSMSYDKCIMDGTKTPVVSVMIHDNSTTSWSFPDLLNFNAADQEAAANNDNIEMQTVANERWNELSTPATPQTDYHQSERIDAIVNNELCLSDAAEPLEFELETTNNMTEEFESYIEPAEVIIDSSNDEVIQPIVDDAPITMPSMPELFYEPSAEETVPETSNDPSAKQTVPQTSEEPIIEKTAPESLVEPSALHSMEITSTESVPSLPEIDGGATSMLNAIPDVSDVPCTSQSILNSPIKTNDETAIEIEEINNNDLNQERQTKDDDVDCEMILVETHTQLQPFIKKEEPLDIDDTENGDENSFKDTPSNRKCNRFVDLTEEEYDDDILIIESDEEEPIEQKFVSILTNEKLGCFIWAHRIKIFNLKFFL